MGKNLWGLYRKIASMNSNIQKCVISSCRQLIAILEVAVYHVENWLQWCSATFAGWN